MVLPQSYNCMDNELQTITRQALIKHRFYQLSSDTLKKILALLQYPPSELASYIEQYSIRGLLKLSLTYTKRQVANHFKDHKFSSIPDSIKTYVTQISNSIRNIIMENRKTQPLFGRLSQNQEQFLRMNQNTYCFEEENQQKAQEQNDDCNEEESEEEESISVEMIDAAVQTDLNLLQEEFIIFPREKKASNLFIDDQAQYLIYLKKKSKRQRMLLKKKAKEESQNKRQQINIENQQFKRQQQENIQINEDQLDHEGGVRGQARKVILQQNKSQEIIVSENQRQILANLSPIRLQEDENKRQMQIISEEVNNNSNNLTFSLKELLQLHPHQPNPQSNTFDREASSILKISLQSNNILRFQSCPCLGSKSQLLYYKCAQCYQYFHFACTSQQPNESSSNSCHNCLLKSLIPHHQVVEQLFRGCLESDGLNSLNAEINVNPYDYYCNLFIRKYELQLRCISISSDSNNEPIITSEIQSLSVRINNCEPEEYSTKDSFDIERVKNKRKYSIYLTKQAYPQYGNKNHLYKTPISFTLLSKGGTGNSAAPGPIFYIGVYFIKKLQNEEIIQKIAANLKTANTKIYNQLLNQQKTQKINCDLEHVKTKTVYRTPVRGSGCFHLECFDLDDYARLMSEWKIDIKQCLICHQRMSYIVVDPVQKYLIGEATALNKHPKAATFCKNGKIIVNLASEEELALHNLKAAQAKKPPRRKRRLKGEQKMKKEIASLQQKGQEEEELSRLIADLN